MSPLKEMSPETAATRTADLAGRLGKTFESLFEDLFEVYLHYAKVDLAEDVDATASALYAMTESKWKAFLRDATIVGPGKQQLTTHQGSIIFTNINLRRENQSKKGTFASEPGVRGKHTAVAVRAAVTDEVTKMAHKQRSAGEQGSNTAMYAGGSVHGFTFSEFLEGLVVVAMELPQPTGLSPHFANELRPEYVQGRLRALLEERVVPHARKAGILNFRSSLLDSVIVESIRSGIKSDLDKIYYKVAQAPAKLGTSQQHRLLGPSSVGFPLKSFLTMCEEAQLIGVQAVGRQLSRMQVKSVFLSSLEITATSSYARRPLLTRHEFDEALLRLAYMYDASVSLSDTSGSVPSGTPLAARQLRGHSVLPQDGDARAAMFAKEVAANIEPKADEPLSPLDVELLAKLPLVVGRLLAMFEQIHHGAAHGACNEPFVVEDRYGSSRAGGGCLKVPRG